MTPDEALVATVREEWGRLVARLLAQFRRLDLVEDALADAVEAAARTWPRDGVPDRPAAWLTTAARRRVLDRLRAEAMAARTRPLLVVDAEVTAALGSVRADPGDLVDDDVLRLVLMCCHPALSPEVASALALRLVVGVTTADIARLFLVPEPTMAARVTRGKRKIVTAGIPFGVPDASALPERLEVVAQVAYLAFTAGYAPGSGPDLLRSDLSGEAVRLVRVTLALRPDEPVLRALLALLLLQHSRRDARVGDDGRLVLLPDQDRSRWHLDEVAEALDLLEPDAGRRHLRARRELPPPGPRGGRARDGGHGIRHPVGPDLRALRGPGGAQPVAGRAARGGRRAGRAGRPARGSPGARRPRRRRCRTATGSRRCAASCSRGPVSPGRPSRRSTSRSSGARNDVEREHLTRRRDELAAGRR